MRRRTRNAIVLGAVFFAVAALAYTTFADAAEYYYDVDQLARLSPAEASRTIRVHGTIAPGSIDWRPAVPELDFRLEWGGASVPVVYRGVRPDVFREGLESVVTGRLEGGRLVATDVTVKCPSKYEAAPSGG